MESHRRIGGFRALLPFEIKLCESIGITDKEYFEFLDLIEAKPVKADIVNMPAALPAWMVVTTATGGLALSFWGTVAITVALAAISYLIADKPKDQGAPPTLTIGGVQGRSRFNPQSGFQSLQDLAELGSFIPLVYARCGGGIGGVRLKSQLLWSQVRTAQYGETISAICLFSNGKLREQPPYAGLALGETYLTDLPASKQKVYFSTGERTLNRLKGVADTQTSVANSDQYSVGSALNKNNYESRGEREYDDVDPFKVKVFAESYNSQNEANFVYKPSFSGTKTPSTNNTFGVFSPMPNGSAYRVRWELLLLMKDGDDGVKKDSRIKMAKVTHNYPRYVGVTNSGESYFYSGAHNQLVLTPNQTQSAIDDPRGDLIVNYRIYHDDEESEWIDSSITDVDVNKKWNKFSPWGSSDAKSVADTTRETVDDTVSLGEQYMVGSTLMTVIKEDDGRVWIPGVSGFQKAIQLKADEGGYLEFRNTNEKALPYESLIVQKVELGTFSNTRNSDVTEIGIKSTVWRRISGFPNVNEMPSHERIKSYENKNGSIQVGSIDKYVKRLSFFKVQAKKLNSGDKFVDITSQVLCVEGSSPIDQYNAIFIHHDSPSQYEFRFLPVPGNVVLNYADDRVVHVLNYTHRLQSYRNRSLGLTIAYHAKDGQLPVKSNVQNGSILTNNPEWDRGGLGSALPITDEDGNTVIGGPANNFYPALIGVDQFAPPTYNWISGAFQPDGVTTYFGNGRNNNPGAGQPLESQHTNVSNYNYKGTPAVGNSYFSPQKGIAAVAIKTSPEIWTWHLIFGGSLLPNGLTVPVRANHVPMGDDDWMGPVVGSDGVKRRFRIARNPNYLGGEEDWRYKNSNGHNVYAIAVQEQTSDDVTETVTIHDTTAITGVGTGFQVSVTTKTDGSNVYRRLRFHNGGNNYVNYDKVTINGISGTTLTIIGTPAQPVEEDDDDEHADWESDGTAGFYTRYWNLKRHNVNNAIADYFLYDSESSSHESGPEHKLTYVNEITHEETSGTAKIQYEKLAIGGIRVGASNTLSSFNSFSAFIKQGISIDRLIPDHNYTSGTGYLTRNSHSDATNNFVEIAHDLLTNKEYGAGDLVGHDGVDRANMIEGARYCRANEFFWDGVIDRRFNLREFIFEHAAYNFLDFTILGGRFSLKPTFPIDADYKINYNATVDNKGIDIRALFTDGNMKDIKVTFLTPEQRTMFKATVIHRDNQINRTTDIGGFAENIARTFAYNPNNEDDSTFFPKAEQLPEETFDLSNWCTNPQQAKLFAAIALSIRKEIDHGIVFQTPPSSVFGLLGGDYIRVLTEATHTSRFNNGSIDDKGKVICRSTISGSINAYVWSPGTLGGIEKKSFSVNSAGTNSAGLKNKLFAQVDSTIEDRIYKVESITYGEDGLIQVAASHVPLKNGKLAVLYNADPGSINGVDFAERFPELR